VGRGVGKAAGADSRFRICFGCGLEPLPLLLMRLGLMRAASMKLGGAADAATPRGCGLGLCSDRIEPNAPLPVAWVVPLRFRSSETWKQLLLGRSAICPSV
jgi:hypothetical protein